ncbi:MAG: leucine-rich repeat protein [Ruminococcus sp.]|nr:leucine-rich repeat protein [Ruminococcus sp.]
MKKLRKILSAVLVALMVFSAIPTLSANAYSYGQEDGFAYYVTDEGTAVFTAYRGEEIHIVIPETLGGYPVTDISGSGSMEWGENVKSITLPSTVAEIHWGAFWGLGIEEITLNEGLKKIGESAFAECEKLESIVLPDSLESIGNGAFELCSKLKSINIPEKVIVIPDSLFNSCDFESFEIPAHIRQIGNCVFSGNKNFKEITVARDNLYYSAVDGVLMNKEQTEILLYPRAKADNTYKVANTVKKIGQYAFAGCSSLDEITLPEGLELIEKNAFTGCNFEYLSIPDTVTDIEASAFVNCDNLEVVTLGDGLISISGGLFANCDNLETVCVGSSVKNLGDYAFENCRSLREVTLPDGLERIGGRAFINCTNLEYLVMPNTVKELGTEAFMDCKSLINVTLSEKLSVIEQNCFKGCVELRYMVIPDSVTEIHRGAFYGCVDLRSVEFGSKVNYIADVAFGDCQSLTRITIPDNVTYLSQYSIGYNTYINCHMVTEYSLCPWVIIYANKDSAAIAYAKEKGLMIGILDGDVSPYSRGDVDGDGKISVKDATLIQKYLANLVTLEQIQENAADVAGTPEIRINDATTIQKYVAGYDIKI